MPDIFSSSEQLLRLADILTKYARLPFYTFTVPGSILEGTIATIRDAEVLRTYDFVDVVDSENRIGWQVKSTLAGTPVTWKRAKIPAREKLIDASRKSSKGLQSLGDAIIDFCNTHAATSLDTYNLTKIGYSRLVIHRNGEAMYFERLLCTNKSPRIFNRSDFQWRWSSLKNTTKKEQLPALHGIHRETGTKWFAWHGLGENQLHFSGERMWWPEGGEPHTITFRLPDRGQKLTLEGFIELLAKLPELPE